MKQVEATTRATEEHKADNSTVSVTNDEVPPEDSTETDPLSAEERSVDNDNEYQSKKSPTKSETSTNSNDLDSSIVSGADIEVMESPPRGLSVSNQDLELSSLSTEGNQRPLQKSISNMGFLKKVPGYSLRSSFRSDLKKNKRNGSVHSSEQDRKPFDTASMASQNSIGNPFEDERGSNSGLWHDEDGGSSNSNQLNREKSRSTLSVTSFTRLNRSLRLSSKKASKVLRKIGSKKEKVSRSETSTPEPTRRLQYPPLSADTSPIAHPKSNEDDNAENPIHSTPISSAPQEDLLNLTPNKIKSVRLMFKPRGLRTFSSLGDSSAKGTATPEENKVEEKEGGGSTHTQKAPQNPIEIQDYLSSLGKAHLKAELVAYANIPIKVSLTTATSNFALSKNVLI